MRNASKISRQFLIIALFWASVLGYVQPGYSGVPHQNFQVTNLNVWITSRTSNSVSFSWDRTAPNYKVWYHKHGEPYTSPVLTTSGTTFSFHNLPLGSYDFYFEPIIEDEAPGYVILEDLLMG
ncbi:MAG: hypothetical protein IT260_00475 [Saprospiraceae bacterium]|nr:hypothetical protein [Saprospiraceae bacterium]